MQSNMSIAQNSYKNNLLFVTLICFFFFLSGFNALQTRTKTLEVMQTNLFQKLSNYPSLAGSKMGEIRKTISQLIEMSKQDEFEQYQRTSFDILITKTRELVDDMLAEQRAEDIQYRNVTNLLMNYHTRQELALEMVQDKYKLSDLFMQFVNSIETTSGKVEVDIDYNKLANLMLLIRTKLGEYQEVQKAFSEKLSNVYSDLKERASDLAEELSNNQNPYLEEAMEMIKKKLPDYNPIGNENLIKAYDYNINAKMEMDLIEKYLQYFNNRAKNGTTTIDFNFFPGYEKEVKEARNEMYYLKNALDSADEALNITTNSIKSNFEEYQANVKTRRDVVEVIYQILDLMNKRAKKIKGYQLAYIDVARTKFLDYENSYEFKNFTRYVFKGPNANATELINNSNGLLDNLTISKLPDLPGIEDDKAEAPKLEDHINVNVNTTVTF